MMRVWTKPTQINAADPGDHVLAPDVVLVLVGDGTARLLDMDGTFYALPAIGAQMLQGTLERGRTTTVRELAHRYQTGADQVGADMDSLVRQLRQQGLLRHGRQRWRRAALWPALILLPCLYLIRRLRSAPARAAALLTLAYLSLACFGWRRTVALWRRGLGAPPWRRNAPPDEPTVRALDQAVRRAAAGHPLPLACKERALSCWALARWAGAPASLVVGLDLFPLAGHCWCEAGPWILSDNDDTCGLFTPVIRYE